LDNWIPVLTGPVIRPVQRGVTPVQGQQLKDQVSQWLGKKIIEPIKHQELNNNVVFVAKKDGRIRVCIDCTPVNSVSEDYTWPLPKLQDVWAKHQGSTWFTRLDLKDAFFRFLVPQEYRRFTAFTCAKQQYQFRKMPFGLQDAPLFFQQFMDTHLSQFTNWATWFIDDILISATTLAELRKRTTLVKRKLQQMRSEVNEDKSEYEKQSLLFCGVWVFASGIGPNICKLRAAAELAPPTTKKEMLSALGLVSYLRDFIPLVAHFTAALYPTKSSEPLTRNELISEWAKLTNHIRSAANTLRHWRDGVAADMYADASGKALGALIIQEGKVVAVTSRKLTGAESRYSATDREHLALYHAAKRFRFILHQSDSAVHYYSDHEALLGRKAAELTPRQTRWLTTINQWIPRIEHVAGINNPADYISRWPVEMFGGAIKV